MANNNVVVTVKIAWWFRCLYLPVISFLSFLTGLSPNEKKLDYWLTKAVKVK